MEFNEKMKNYPWFEKKKLETDENVKNSWFVKKKKKKCISICHDKFVKLYFTETLVVTRLKKIINYILKF